MGDQILQNNPLEYEKVSILLRRFAIPSIVAMLVSSLYNVIDQLFIVQKMGYLGNAVTNVAYPMTTITLAASLLIGVGGATRFSLNLGRKQEQEAASTVGNMLWMSLIFGVLLSLTVEIFTVPLLNAFGATKTVLPYGITYLRITGIGILFQVFSNSISKLIRADGSPKYAMVCLVTGAVINIVLDPIFIFLFDMGIAGAAWATVLSQVISCGLAVRYLFRLKSVSLRGTVWKPRPGIWLQIATLGMSNSLNQLAITLVQVVMNHSLSYYGLLSVYGEDIPLSGAGVVIKINSMVLAVFIGLSQGAQPLLGFNYGAKQYARVREIYRLAVSSSFIMSTIAFLVFELFPRVIIAIFGNGNELYMEFTVKFMRVFLFMILVNGVQLISSGFFSAIGKPLKGTFLSLARQVVFLIPLMLLLPLKWGLDGILYAAPIADFLAFAISVLFVFREMKMIRKKEILPEVESQKK